MKKEVKNEIIGGVLVVIAILVFLSILSFKPSNDSLYAYPPTHQAKNAAGLIGNWVAQILMWLFGRASYMIPAVFAFFGFCNLCFDIFEIFEMHICNIARS
jgi:hypothetical protein